MAREAVVRSSRGRGRCPARRRQLARSLRHLAERRSQALHLAASKDIAIAIEPLVVNKADVNVADR